MPPKKRATPKPEPVPPQRFPRGPNLLAVDRTLALLTATGHIEDADAAVVQSLRSMAAALDDDPSNAALWRQYRETLTEVRRADDDADAGFAAALAEIRGTTSMGDKPPA